MGKHDVLGDGESQAGASRFTGARFIDAVKAFEQAGEVLGGDAGAEIADVEFHGPLGGARAQFDACTGTAVLHGNSLCVATVVQSALAWPAWLCAPTPTRIVAAVVKTGENAALLNRR